MFEGVRILELGQFVSVPYCAELFAHGLTDLVGAIRLARDEPVPMAARHRHAHARSEDARPGDESRLDGAGQVDVQVLARSEVAHGCESRAKRSSRVFRRFPCLNGSRLSSRDVEAVRITGSRDMNVTVDETGKDVTAGAIQGLGSFDLGALGDERVDPALPGDDVDALAERPRLAVEHGAATEDEWAVGGGGHGEHQSGWEIGLPSVTSRPAVLEV